MQSECKDLKTILVYMPLTFQYLSAKVFRSFMYMVGPESQAALRERGYESKLYISDKFPIDLNRNEAFEASRTNRFKADLIMCCDGDQVFKKNTLMSLLDTLEENPDVDGVTGIYFTKTPPHRAVVGRYSPWSTSLELKRPSLQNEGFIGQDGNQTLFFKHLQYFDVVQPVDVFGLGCLLLKTSVFEKIQQPFCEYVNGYSTGGDFTFQGHSEDMRFCSKLKQAGAKILVNPKVMVGHVVEKIICGNEADE